MATKQDIVNNIANQFGLTKTKSTEIVDTIFAGIGQSLQSGSDVTVHGFGRFAVKQRAARTGRNPQTGKEINIPAKAVVKFVPHGSLKAVK